MGAAHRDVRDVREVGSKALPTQQHLLQGTDHSAPYLNIQRWLLLLGLKLSCGEKRVTGPQGMLRGQGRGLLDVEGLRQAREGSHLQGPSSPHLSGSGAQAASGPHPFGKGLQAGRGEES